MRIATLKEVIRLCKKAGISSFVWGHRGLGKSSIVKQIAAEDKAGIVDMRCSQLESSDIRGLPDRGNGRTIYLPPADMPIADMEYADVIKKIEAAPEEQREHIWNIMQPHFKSGYLFLDEINRAQDDVLQSVFQLILDRRIGQYTLPPQWTVVCAGNFMEGYVTNGFTDPAFLDRFCHVIMSGGDTTMEEWVNYISTLHGPAASKVIEFATQNVKHLDGDIKGELGFSVQPSRRSWDAVIRVMGVCGQDDSKFSEEAKTEVIAGLVGRELALSFQRYDCPVKPHDLINNGVEAMSTRLAGLERNQMTGLVWGMIAAVKPRVKDDKIAKVICDFAEWCCKYGKDKDLVVAFCRSLVSTGNSQEDYIRSAALSNPKLAKMLQAAGSGNKNKSLIDRLNEKPELQKLLSRVVWGID